jgi:4-amino-4-deoxy-L-arabinose transferase-like glycosyltransferase
MGKTWDEGAYVEAGYHFFDLFRKGNFSDPFWYEQSDHPPLARYFYGIAASYDIKSYESNGSPIFYYDFTHPRLVSAILGSLSSVFVVLIGYQFFSRFIGFSSGIIFALIPFFVGLSQLSTLESFIMFFFTGSVYFYLLFIARKKFRYAVFTGIFTGFALLVKQSNVILLPLFLIFSVFDIFINDRKHLVGKVKHHAKGFVIVLAFLVVTFFVFWPMPFFNIEQTLAIQKVMWVDAVKLPPPEVFFGRLMLVPFPYYFVMFLITTPLVLIVLGFVGSLKVDRVKSLLGYLVLAWFLFPFLQSIYAFKQHGVRYIIEIYAPFAILCGIGLFYLGSFFRFRKAKILLLVFVVIYMGFVLVKHNPYYLDYFNEVVGGTKNVYSKKLFQMGWWGQGIGEATYYISEREKSTVTVAVDGKQPMLVVPDINNIKIVDYNDKPNADYVIVPYFNVVRLGFSEDKLSDNYEVVYTVKVNSTPFVKVYRKSKKNADLYKLL